MSRYSIWNLILFMVWDRDVTVFIPLNSQFSKKHFLNSIFSLTAWNTALFKSAIVPYSLHPHTHFCSLYFVLQTYLLHRPISYFTTLQVHLFYRPVSCSKIINYPISATCFASWQSNSLSPIIFLQILLTTFSNLLFWITLAFP